MRRREFLISATSSLLLLPVSAKGLSGAIALSGDRFQIADQEYILADIRSPSKYVLGKSPAPFHEEARAYLQSFMETTNFKIEEIAPTTRWNARVVKASHSAGGPSLQEQMVAIGAARVSPHSDDHAFIDHLLSVERTARNAGKGLWGLQSYKVIDALNANVAIDSYHIIEGVVVSANATRSRFYLNFGEDYRTDFTASAKSAQYRRWVRDEFDLKILEGIKVRIRGFVVDINGPSIDLTHSRQIEISDHTHTK